MGEGYLYLIKQFVDAANQKAGSFCTPRRLVLLMVAIADPQEGEMVYGPACGTGGICPALRRCGAGQSALGAGAYAAFADQEGFAAVGNRERLQPFDPAVRQTAGGGGVGKGCGQAAPCRRPGRPGRPRGRSSGNRWMAWWPCWMDSWVRFPLPKR